MISKAERIISWTAQLVTAGILLQTLYFKFTAAPESVYIFSELDMEPWGRIGSGIVELFASILLLTGRYSVIGALISAVTISGALFLHLTTLGIVVQDDGGLLFWLGVTVLMLSIAIIWIRRTQLPLIGGLFRKRKNPVQ